VIILILIYAVWTIRDYKPLVVILIVLFINIYILLTSNETAINERLFNTIFLFIILIKSKRWIIILFSIIFLYSIFNLKNFTLSNEIKDKIIEISHKERAYLSIYHFYNEKYIQKLSDQKNQITDYSILSGFLAKNTHVPTLGIAHLKLNNNCFIYIPYKKHIPYLPPNCKVIYEINKDILSESENPNIYIDPFLKEYFNSYKWSCEDLKSYLKNCNNILRHYTSSNQPLNENFINNACNIFSRECVQKYQFYCNYLYYCR